MNFPKESMDMIKGIATQYRLRQSTAIGRLNLLYNDAFLEVQYGFDDVLKTGKAMIYPHEIKTTCDCDSYAGVLYALAKELNLKPKIYSAYGMQDAKLGESRRDIESVNHTFITTLIGKKLYILDPFYHMCGESKIEGNKITIVENDHGHKSKTERLCNILSEMTEEEYMKRFHETREGGGRSALSIGRVIQSYKRRICLEYLTDTKQLASTINARIEGLIIDKGPSNFKTISLIGDVSDDGKWDVENGKFRMFSSTAAGWTLEQFKDVHDEIIIPYSLSKEYVKNLHTAIRHSGRKSPIYYVRTHQLRNYFMDRGFSETGEIVKPNGVDKKEHDVLNAELWKHLPTNTPQHIMQYNNQLAVFYWRKNNLRMSGQKWISLYSEEEHQKFIKEYSEMMRKDINLRADLVYNNIMAQSGLMPHPKKTDEAIQRHVNGENTITEFRDRLSRRHKNKEQFDRDIDLALFQREHPAGTLVATPEELDYFYRRDLFQTMALMAFADRALEVRDKRKGLERLLAIDK